jgi:hypothetical protein
VIVAQRVDVLSTIVRGLTPYVGATMARASTHGVSEKLRLSRAELTGAEARTLVDALAPGLAVFIGRDKSRTVIEEIWAAVDALGAKR